MGALARTCLMFSVISIQYSVNASGRSQMFHDRGLLKNFENTQENTCTVVSFSIKLQARSLQLY